MCGRFSFDLSVELLERFFALDEVRREPETSYNVAPPEDGPVVLEEDGVRALDAYRWGLVPGWSDDLDFGARTINARAETIHEKPAFREAFRHRRCVVPVSGFFEWQDRPSGRKVPHHLRDPAGDPLPLAGLWERWTGDGAEHRTFAVVTTDPNATVEPVHHRMPVVLERGEVDRWLGADAAEADELRELLYPAPADRLEGYEVPERVNDAAEDGPDLVEPRRDGGRSTRLDDFRGAVGGGASHGTLLCEAQPRLAQARWGVAEEAWRRTRREATRDPPISCYLPALLQCIVSCRGGTPEGVSERVEPTDTSGGPGMGPQHVRYRDVGPRVPGLRGPHTGHPVRRTPRRAPRPEGGGQDRHLRRVRRGPHHRRRRRLGPAQRLTLSFSPEPGAWREVPGAPLPLPAPGAGARGRGPNPHTDPAGRAAEVRRRRRGRVRGRTEVTTSGGVPRPRCGPRDAPALAPLSTGPRRGGVGVVVAEASQPPIEVVEEIDEVPVPVQVEERIAYLAEHLGLAREDVAGKLLTMIFREGLEWQDLRYLRQLTDDVTPESDGGRHRTS